MDAKCLSAFHRVRDFDKRVISGHPAGLNQHSHVA